jgi:8-oxo-dGTP pyrophosphatase MutT (NUDIX family)
LTDLLNGPMEPVHRISARVLPVSPEGEVLLLQDIDPTEPDVLRWGTIGGALDAGETHQDAAVREMYEETGLVIAAGDLTPSFHRSSHDFSWNGVTYRGDNSFFAVPLARDVEVSFEHLEPDEVDTVMAWRWWTPAAVEAAGGMIHPDLPQIMTSAIEAVHGR